MHCNSSYFNNFLDYFENNNNIFEYIKFIFPESPIMDINYPKNKLINVKSWYNYYSYYNNVNKIDKINIQDFQKSSMRIINIIFNEAFILNSFKKIYLIGVSQGGTLLLNILNKLPISIGGLFIIKSIFMYKYIKLKKDIKTPLFIYSGANDKVYNLKFQKFCYKKLLSRKIYYKWTIINNLDHHKIISKEHKFIINNFLNNLL